MTEHQDPSALLRSTLTGYWKAQVAASAVQLGLPERLSGRASEASALARELRLHEDSLFRLLRAMAAIGLACDEGDMRFSLTAAGELLRPDVAGSMRGMALHVGTLLWPAFGHLADAVRTGAPPPGIRYGPHGFAELNTEPEQAAIFNQSMVDGSKRIGALAEILKANPNQRGLILDLSHAQAGASTYLKSERVAERAQYVTSSFFDEIPADEADCYVLKYIIHDWNDENAAKIVARVGAAARRSRGTVVLLERPLPERVQHSDEHAGAMQGDLTMMLWDGKERTLADYRALFEAAGLKVTRSVPIGDGFSAIEGQPA